MLEIPHSVRWIFSVFIHLLDCIIQFKALEAMAEQVKPDPVPSHITNPSSTKVEKNALKPRGSGSPFKCIGLGLSQQINSEKDEELAARRLRIEELEALAASRQKEVSFSPLVLHSFTKISSCSKFFSSRYSC